jgi:hypothetical protein
MAMTHYFQPWVNHVISLALALATTTMMLVSVSALYGLRRAEQRACELEYRASVSRALHTDFVRQPDWCVALHELRGPSGR